MRFLSLIASTKPRERFLSSIASTTATPKNKTIELFGTYDPQIKKKRPFHIYSMRQAIEEKFILDVLQSYTTIKEALYPNQAKTYAKFLRFRPIALDAPHR